MITSCNCLKCGNPIEFEVEHSSESAECPHCGQQTLLALPPVNIPAATKPKSRMLTWIFISAASVLLTVALVMVLKATNKKAAEPSSTPNIIAQLPKTNSPPPLRKLTEEEEVNALRAKPMLMSSEEKEARDHILKSLLDISSATALGVNRNKYSDLVTSALSMITFEKTKLSTERHTKYLICAAKAIGYYAKANKEWSDYFEYDWMRESKETIMTQNDFDDLLENGVKLTNLHYRPGTEKRVFYVSFDDCLSVYWRAADIYIEKMKADVQK